MSIETSTVSVHVFFFIFLLIIPWEAKAPSFIHLFSSQTQYILAQLNWLQSLNSTWHHRPGELKDITLRWSAQEKKQCLQAERLLKRQWMYKSKCNISQNYCLNYAQYKILYYNITQTAYLPHYKTSNSQRHLSSTRHFQVTKLCKHKLNKSQAEKQFFSKH